MYVLSPKYCVCDAGEEEGGLEGGEKLPGQQVGGAGGPRQAG